MTSRVIALAASMALTGIAIGAGTSHWTHSEEAEFKNGTFHNTVATNLGDVKLSRAIKTLLEQDPRVNSVYALAEGADGTIYAGTGPHGIVLQIKEDRISTLLTLADENIFSLLIDNQGKLLIGTGGEKGRILRVEKPGEKPVEIFAADEVQYVWQMRQTADGNLYAATGPSGQVHEVRPDGGKSVLFDSDENNILSLASDGGELLFAGSDPNGLVYRINRKTKEVFVLFDAPESEISSLVLDAKGNVYAGTGQAPEGEVPGAAEVAVERAGRPEGGESVTPLPSPVPKEPEPPALPDPNPNEPDPIPKAEPKEPAAAQDDEALQREMAEVMRRVDEISAEAQKLAMSPVPPPAPRRPRTAPRGGVPGRAVPGAPEQRPAGNAVYRIDREGFVTEVFRHPGMVLSMVEQEGVLLVGTGSEGLVYQVNPAAEETVVLAKIDSKQVMAMLARKEGTVVLGLANVGGLASMSSGYAAAGEYTSPVLDAGQISRFGKVQLQGSLPEGSTLSIATRSGNLQEPGATGWSGWSEEMPAVEFVQVPSPAARFLQYRLTFKSAQEKSTAVVEQVDVAYALPNLAPRIKSIKIAGTANPAGGEGPAAPGQPPVAGPPPKPTSVGRMRTITWESSDPNGDAMEYTLHYRSGTRGPWIQLQEKVKGMQYQWDTRGTGDGRYQVRITASDARANPQGEGRAASRVSDLVAVDNTAPRIGDLRAEKLPGAVRIQGSIVDRGSRVASVAYAVDSAEDWQAVAASDTIFDSPEEGVDFRIDGLSPGAHQIVLRARDEHGNQAFETVMVMIDAPAAK